VPTSTGSTCPTLIDLALNGKINPGKVFDLTLPLAQVAEVYRAMDERRAIKTFVAALNY
jgi:threonine dehydrogenase-like Zn-dependent dehydrogenase